MVAGGIRRGGPTEPPPPPSTSTVASFSKSAVSPAPDTTFSKASADAYTEWACGAGETLTFHKSVVWCTPNATSSKARQSTGREAANPARSSRPFAVCLFGGRLTFYGHEKFYKILIESRLGRSGPKRAPTNLGRGRPPQFSLQRVPLPRCAPGRH